MKYDQKHRKYLLNAGFGNSTIFGWKKRGEYPYHVAKLLEQCAEIDRLTRLVESMESVIAHLSKG